MQGLRLHAAVVVATVALTSCSMARLGYDALPTWVHWQAERYLDLDSDQRAIVGRRIDELHQWHRRSQLPKYVEFLRAVDDEMRSPVDASHVGRWRDRVGEAWELVAERLAPGVAELALTLRKEQIDRLHRRLEEGNANAREKLLPAGETARDEARLERIVDRAEFFLGDLSRSQQRELKPLVAAMPSDEEAWLAEREIRQHHLIALLEKLRREQPTRAEATRLCREYLLSMWQSRDARRRHRIERSIAASDALSAQVLSQATPKQREHLSKLLNGFANDFESLSRVAAQDKRAEVSR